MGVLMHRCIYGDAPNHLKGYLIQVLRMSNNVLHLVWSLLILMYQVLT